MAARTAARVLTFGSAGDVTWRGRRARRARPAHASSSVRRRWRPVRSAGRRAPGRQRGRRGGDGARRSGVGARRGGRTRSPASVATVAGGWSCTSGPTGWWSSTTPTTPTPPRCVPRSRRSPASALPGRAHGRRARRDARARRRVGRGHTPRSAASRPRPASTSWSPSARRPTAIAAGAAPYQAGRVRRSSRRAGTRHCMGAENVSAPRRRAGEGVARRSPRARRRRTDRLPTT